MATNKKTKVRVVKKPKMWVEFQEALSRLDYTLRTMTPEQLDMSPGDYSKLEKFIDKLLEK